MKGSTVLLLLLSLYIPRLGQQAGPELSSFLLLSSRPQSEQIEGAKRDRSEVIYLVHSLAEKTLAINNVKVKALGVARLANALWDYDEPYARMLFEKGLTLASGQGGRDNTRVLSSLRRGVLAIIARRDANWAKQLIDDAIQRNEGEQDPRARSEMNMGTALSLLDGDPHLAVQFADRSLQGNISPAFLDFLLALRKTDAASADQLFLRAVSYLGGQPAVDVTSFHALGIYLFTAPNLLDSDNYAVTRVGDILVPNIAVQRPGVPLSLVRAYLATAGTILLRAVSEDDQKQFSYTLAYLLLPKARSIAPDLAAPIETAMSGLMSGVPSNLRDDSAYKYITAAASNAEERLANAEKKPNQEGRDAAYLDLTLWAWLRNDFKTARTASSRIADQDASRQLDAVIDFGEAAWSIKQNPKKVADAEAVAKRLPECIERSILFLSIARTKAKIGQAAQAEEAVEAALKTARSLTEVRRPFLTLIAAAELADLHSQATQFVLADAIKDFNSFDEAAFAAIDWADSVQTGPLKARFPLNRGNIEFRFNSAFRAVISMDLDSGIARAEDFRNEDLRSQAFVEVATALLERLPKNNLQNEQAIRVGEDGIRKSASKTYMPLYPQEALGKQQQGVAVVEVQYDGKGEVTSVVVLEAPAKSIGEAVVEAVKRWKFVPSRTQEGKPVSIRGKLTFYFVIDKEGKGRVENPKQFR
jgi:TonB family protein